MADDPDPVRHCWADFHSQFPVGSPEWCEAYALPSATCMLPAGHDGPHVYTPDGEIRVTFPPRPEGGRDG